MQYGQYGRGDAVSFVGSRVSDEHTALVIPRRGALQLHPLASRVTASGGDVKRTVFDY